MALVLLTACGGGAAPDGAPPTLPGRFELPEYDLARYKGLIASLEGTPVVVNIWGSWCPPCRKEAPYLSSLAREFDERVRFLGVDILDERDAAKGFMREFSIPYPSVFDPDAEIRDGLGYLGQPVTIVYDASGEVSYQKTGEITEAELRGEIRKVL